MTLSEAVNKIEELERNISKSSINKTPLEKDILSFIESCYNLALEKDNEIKTLNNTIKIMKGEQPVPDFNKKSKDFSSSKELSKAESGLPNSEDKDGFKLSQDTLDKLKEKKFQKIF